MRILLNALCPILLFLSPNAQASEKAPPNVLVLFTDDHRADTIAALGNPVIKTPALDRLVKSGVAFQRAYMQGGFHGATCVPSRAMLLSGRCLFAIDEKMMAHENWPETFGKAGYKTFVSGKWHNGTPSVLKTFQNVRSMLMTGMTDPLKAPLSQVVDGKLAKPEISKKHACEVFADEAIAFLANHQKTNPEAPFLAYVPFDGPHDPHIVPADFAINYTAEEIPLPANFLPQHPWDNGDMKVRDEKLLPMPRTETAVRGFLAEYYRYISYLDVQIGRILDALEKSPYASNTIIVFAGDSGVARGSHGLVGKQNLYEHSVRVPLIIRGPGIPANKRSQALCYLYDVFPTLGKLCGVAPAVQDMSCGQEMTQTLLNPSQPARSSLVFAYRKAQRAICEDRWKLIHYPLVAKTQLFDLKADPQEITNLAENPNHTAERERLIALMQAELKKAGDKLSE